MVKLKTRLKKFFYWLKTKRWLMDTIIEQRELIETLSKPLKIEFESFEQNRIYVCTIKDATQEQLQEVRDAFKYITNSLPWTPPTIILINKEIKKKVIKCEDLSTIRDM